MPHYDNERGNCSKTKGDDDDIIVCCKHGRRCRIGKAQQSTKSGSTSSNKKKNGEYEKVRDLDLSDVSSVADKTVVTNDWDNRSEQEKIEQEKASSKDNKEGDQEQSKVNKDEYEYVPDNNGPTKSGLEGGINVPLSTVSIATSDEREETEERFERSSKKNVYDKSSLSLTDWAKSDDQLTRVNPKEVLIEYYIGICLPTSAEALCKKARAFRLYHQISTSDDDNLPSFLPLYIVHLTHNSGYRHIRVLKSRKTGYLRVDIEDEPQFYTLSQLITFYEIYASFSNKMEPFPDKASIVKSNFDLLDESDKSKSG